jgi:hypothetical protein
MEVNYQFTTKYLCQLYPDELNFIFKLILNFFKIIFAGQNISLKESFFLWKISLFQRESTVLPALIW